MNKFSALTLRVSLLFTLALTLVGIASTCLYISILRFEKQHEWVDHTYEVTAELQSVMSELRDIQASQRGFIITGNEAYLEPYHTALPILETSFQRLEMLIRSDSSQQERLKILREKVQIRMDLAEEIINVFRASGQNAAFEMVLQGTGKQEMDEIHHIDRLMVIEQKNLLNKRRTDVKNSLHTMLLIGGAGLVTCITIIFAAFWTMRKEMLRRAAARESMEKALATTRKISLENELMGQMSGYFQSCKTEAEAYDIISRSAAKIFLDTLGFISVFNTSRNRVETVLYWGRPCCNKSQEFQPDECWALRRGQSHRIHGNGVEPLCPHITDRPPGGAICIPMLAHGETIGLFCIAADKEQTLDDHTRMTARAVSEQISLAIANIKLQDALLQKSIRDPMTHLFNRRYMEGALEQEVLRAERHKTPLSIVMLDIDHFKRFNDTYGHDAGDAVLIEFARLVADLAGKDNIACRYGGEEFLIIMPLHDAVKAAAWAENLCEATRRMRVTLQGKMLENVTVSIGLVEFPFKGNTTPVQLVTRADTALYKAKQNGRDQVVVAEPAE